MKIGVIYCAYSLPEYIKESLQTWVDARGSKLGGHTFVISAISVPFKEYKGVTEEDLESPKILNEFKERGQIDYLFTEPKWGEEREVRNTALNPLLDGEKCDLIFLVDNDEFYQLDEIQRIIKFVEFNKFIPWFRGSLKNYVFDLKTHLKEPFTPARIHRTDINGLKLYGFRFDNEMVYVDAQKRIIDHEQLPCLTIPKSVAWVSHYSWLSNEKTKGKLFYQVTRWTSSMCSFKWNEVENKLEFNPEYYARFGKPIPEVVREE